MGEGQSMVAEIPTGMSGRSWAWRVDGSPLPIRSDGLCCMDNHMGVVDNFRHGRLGNDLSGTVDMIESD